MRIGTRGASLAVAEALAAAGASATGAAGLPAQAVVSKVVARAAQAASLARRRATADGAGSWAGPNGSRMVTSRAPIRRHALGCIIGQERRANPRCTVPGQSRSVAYR